MRLIQKKGYSSKLQPSYSTAISVSRNGNTADAVLAIPGPIMFKSISGLVQALQSCDQAYTSFQRSL